MENNFIYKQLFFRFLKDKNAYGPFNYNLKIRHKTMQFLYDPSNYLISAFAWGKGAGTIEYWHNLHKQWKSVVLGKRLQDF